eukprot:12812224-Alexandrium_andersonii.AAC.1
MGQPPSSARRPLCRQGRQCSGLGTPSDRHRATRGPMRHGTRLRNPPTRAARSAGKPTTCG